MKKIVALTLVIMMVLGLTACGGSGKNDDQSSSTTSTTQKENQDTGSETTNDINSTIPNEEESSNAKQPEEKEETTTPDQSENNNQQEQKEETTTPDQSKNNNQHNNDNKQEQKEETKVEEDAKEESVDNKNNYFFNENNNTYSGEGIFINARHVYWEDGKLFAECFVINGLSYNVSGIQVESLQINNKSGAIVKACNFGTLDSVVLAPATHIIHTFIFSPDEVIDYGADLSWLNVKAKTTYKY